MVYFYVQNLFQMNRILFFTCLLLLLCFLNTAQIIWAIADQREVAKIPSDERGVEPRKFQLRLCLGSYT
ncbi:MAG: hypothetical protein ACI9IZ_000817 [Nonlabens sp.]